VSELIFAVLQRLNVDEAALMVCIIWSIWKQRNNRVWNDVTDTQSVVFSRVVTTLNDWRAVQVMRTETREIHGNMEHKWKKHNNGRVKCNIDASFSSNLNRVGIGVCIHDEYGVYVMAKYDQYSPICDVRISEALGLLSALKWVYKLNLGPVDFELDSKLVVDSFHSNKDDVSEFGEIIA
ncbi:cytochrome P450, partial [Trifolium medium]|nr:cytochrome P450 [Trifolium medium]